MTGTAPDQAILLSAWDALSSLAPGDRLYRTRRLKEPSGLDLRIGLRETDGAPCLVAIAEGIDTSAIAAFETGGLRLGRARDESGLLLVLSLEEPGRRDLFAQICADLIHSIADAVTIAPNEAIRNLAERLGAWRSFLRDQSGALQRSELIGIFGELAVLRELLRLEPDALPAWRSPDDGLYDFQRGGWALEVKGTLGTGSRLRVSSLDQLDDAGLAELALAHVRLAEDAEGEGIVAMAARLEQALPSERWRREFRNALLRRGLPPDLDEAVSPSVRIVGMDFYRVLPGFPRLRRRDVPWGIIEASYELEVRSLSDYATPAADILSGLQRYRDG